MKFYLVMQDGENKAGMELTKKQIKKILKEIKNGNKKYKCN